MLLPSKSSLASVQKKVGLLTSDYILFKKYDDKDLSFTDCTSFALMKRLKVQTAFTFDGHFQQVGFMIW